MHTEHNIESVRRHVQQWRRSGERIALVPTMGNLHAGHMELVTQARQMADRVVVSVFVNPAQFGAGEDFSLYPRTSVQDAALLKQAKTDLLFSPEVEDLYFGKPGRGTWVEVPGVSKILCGASRPDHFRGVATVVAKFFNSVQPDLAFFGEKDYQQLLIIRKMTSDLCFPVEIVAVPTVRADDGLALSSRNAYLTPEQRKCAPLLYRLMMLCKERIIAGERDYGNVVSEAKNELYTAGFEPDYVEVRSACSLSRATTEDRHLVIMVAARLGETRLIDNVIFYL